MARKKVSSKPVLNSWSDVDKVMRELQESQNCIAELDIDLSRRVAELKDEISGKKLPFANRIKRLEGEIKEFVDMHQAELDGKSRRLTYGRVGYRLSKKLIVPKGNMDGIIQRLKAIGKNDCIKIEEKLDREALKKCPLELILSVGAAIDEKDEFYYEFPTEPLPELVENEAASN